jgi:hypothetical protein
MDGNKASQLAVPGEPWRTGAILSQLEASLRPSSCLILFAYMKLAYMKVVYI